MIAPPAAPIPRPEPKEANGKKNITKPAKTISPAQINITTDINLTQGLVARKWSTIVAVTAIFVKL